MQRHHVICLRVQHDNPRCVSAPSIRTDVLIMLKNTHTHTIKQYIPHNEICNYPQQLNPNLIRLIQNKVLRIALGRKPAQTLNQNWVVLDYCQYSSPGSRKRTRIAHSDNLHWVPRPLCNPKVCSQCVDGRHILTVQHGPWKTKGLQDNRTHAH